MSQREFLRRFLFQWLLVLGLGLALGQSDIITISSAWAGGSSRTTETKREIASVDGPPKKIVIFYSSIGMGHISASRAIEADIKARDPRATVVLKNIRDFMPKWKERVDEKLFWLIVKNWPNLFDKLFRSAMDRGNQVKNLSQVAKDYDINAMRDFIEAEKPDVILDTHYGSALHQIKLREQGYLRDIKIGWLHTDYFQGFMPRISNGVDMTFLPLRDMSADWSAAGVAAKKVSVTGMPLNAKIFQEVDREAFLSAQGLDPKVTTITLASGGEGVGDFPTIVKSLAEASSSKKLQIVAICAKNENHVKALTELKTKLPENIELVVKGFTPQEELLSFVKSSNLYITKSGGLSPTEGFALQKPLVLLDIYGGHERDNARLFEKLGMAVINRDQASIGEQAFALINDPSAQKQMIAAQATIKNDLSIEKISTWALEQNRTAPDVMKADFGVEGGRAATFTKEAFAKLDQDSPADLVLHLGFSTSTVDKMVDTKENPFGHIALEMDGKVHTVNYLAKSSTEDPNIFLEMTPDEYYFGVEKKSANHFHTGTYGLAYGRDSIALRISGLTSEQKSKMAQEIAQLHKEWRTGMVCYHRSESNCADFTDRILKAAGIDTSAVGPKGKIAMPLDSFDRALSYFESHNEYGVDLVSIARVQDSQNAYRYSRFPISLKQLKRSIRNLLWPGSDPLEGRATRRIVSYAAEEQVHYEAIPGRTRRLPQPAKTCSGNLALLLETP